MTPFCAADIKADEGLRFRAYQDTLGFWTIGYGHAGVAPGTVWTQARADAQFARDLEEAVDGLNTLIPWWTSLSDARQDVMANMAFQLGVKGLLAFKNALLDIRMGNFVSASHDMLASLWARQTSARAQRLAKQMETGARARGQSSQ